MNKLSLYSIEELQEEINRRDRKKEEKPQPLVEKDFSSLITTCEDYINEIAEKEYADEDYKEWIYEAALNAVYGESIWNWKNKR